jgi:alkylated DNA repair dioxygenase AlkB
MISKMLGKNVSEKKESKKIVKKTVKKTEKIQLSSKSWIMVKENAVECTEDEFEEFWSMHPETRDTVVVYGKEHLTPRFQKLYGTATYSFSGATLSPDPEVPKIVQRCADISQKMFPEYKFNGFLVNWYPDGSSYIGFHADKERELVPGAPICSFSFGGTRTFRIKAKEKQDEDVDIIVEEQDFPTLNKSLIVMGGDMQKEFKHAITKTAKKVNPRINVTVRAFVE